MKDAEAARVVRDLSKAGNVPSSLRVVSSRAATCSETPSIQHVAETSLCWKRRRTFRLDPSRILLASLMAALFTLALLWIAGLGAEQRTIAALPAGERAVFYRRTLHDLEDVCGTGPSSTLRHYCSEQANLLAALPECGPDCRALIRPLLAQPTR